MRLAGEGSPGWLPEGRAGIFWLGQAGFWIDTGAHRILIDPYLSDSLARKYAGKINDHRRMMSPPATVADLPPPDIVLVTHAHTDHMDPDTLGPLAVRFPDLPFVVPAARLDVARVRIGAEARLIAVDAGARLEPLPGLRIDVLPAAHETRETDAAGAHVFLGFGMTSGGGTIWHSGDCVPFEGLLTLVRRLAPDIALLPVNGRDAVRLAAGVPGNFTLAEAIGLARDADVPFLVPHHFGMFDFNTCDVAEIDRAAAATVAPRIIRPVAGTWIGIEND
jgi:L-ascorbate metabolism protein UlaG (beta-lactamase superfamily)